MILDMLRALHKSEGFLVMCEEIQSIAERNSVYGKKVIIELDHLQITSKKLLTLEKDNMEAAARSLFQRLTHLYSSALMIASLDNESEKWIKPSLKYWLEKKDNIETLADISEIMGMISWKQPAIA